MPIRPDTRLQRAVDAIAEQGCPVCEELPETTAVEGPAKIVCTPCGHAFPPAAVLDLS